MKLQRSSFATWSKRLQGKDKRTSEVRGEEESTFSAQSQSEKIPVRIRPQKYRRPASNIRRANSRRHQRLREASYGDTGAGAPIYNKVTAETFNDDINNSEQLYHHLGIHDDSTGVTEVSAPHPLQILPPTEYGTGQVFSQPEESQIKEERKMIEFQDISQSTTNDSILEWMSNLDYPNEDGDTGNMSPADDKEDHYNFSNRDTNPPGPEKLEAAEERDEHPTEQPDDCFRVQTDAESDLVTNTPIAALESLKQHDSMLSSESTSMDPSLSGSVFENVEYVPMHEQSEPDDEAVTNSSNTIIASQGAIPVEPTEESLKESADELKNADKVLGEMGAVSIEHAHSNNTTFSRKQSSEFEGRDEDSREESVTEDTAVSHEEVDSQLSQSAITSKPKISSYGRKKRLERHGQQSLHITRSKQERGTPSLQKIKLKNKARQKKLGLGRAAKRATTKTSIAAVGEVTSAPVNKKQNEVHLIALDQVVTKSERRLSTKTEMELQEEFLHPDPELTVQKSDSESQTKECLKLVPQRYLPKQSELVEITSVNSGNASARITFGKYEDEDSEIEEDSSSAHEEVVAEDNDLEREDTGDYEARRQNRKMLKKEKRKRRRKGARRRVIEMAEFSDDEIEQCACREVIDEGPILCHTIANENDDETDALAEDESKCRLFTLDLLDMASELASKGPSVVLQWLD